MDDSVSIVWFRRDLRLDDHPALHEALSRGNPIIPLFIWDPDYEKPWIPGSASRSWLMQSLGCLDQELKKKGSRLIFRQGSTLNVLNDIIASSRVRTILWHRRCEPAVAARDKSTIQHLLQKRVNVRILNGSLLRDPDSIRKENGDPYRVFTAYWNAHRRMEPHRAPLPSLPSHLPSVDSTVYSDTIEADIFSMPSPTPPFEIHGFTPGETGALRALDTFSSEWADQYDTSRDRPDLPGTSRLSPHISWGEISPVRIWHTMEQVSRMVPASSGINTFLREIGWREFAYHLLTHFPDTPELPLRGEFRHFPWQKKPEAYEKWKSGDTGFPIVDAGMRELLHSGWMHNRVRMLTASFLVKNLGISWSEGAQWFWDRLYDADLANNTLGWQWTAGCGADAAPFFRIFNPVLQGQKFDPAGKYVRRWVPELSACPQRFIHTPWLALGMEKPYTDRIVSLIESRQRALNDFQSLSSQ